MAMAGIMTRALRIAAMLSKLSLIHILFPEAIPGLTVGCFLANLLCSPIPLDWIVGTAATLLAALWTSKLHHRALAPLPPVICNMVLVGAEIAWFSTQEGAAFWPAFAFHSLTCLLYTSRCV